MDGSGGTGQIRLSVIVPVHDGEPYLAAQLEALASQECSFEWELIVVDNSSTDASAATALRYKSRFSNFRLLQESRLGKPYALNTGRRAAVGEYLVLLDADDVAASGYLEAMVSGLDEFEMVSSRIEAFKLNPWPQGHLPDFDNIIIYLDFLPSISGGLIGIRAEAWERVGDFDTSLTWLEDMDFSWRAHLAGLTMGLVPNAVLHYRRPERARDNFRKARSHGRAQVWLYQRYRSLGQPRRRIEREFDHLKVAAHEIFRHDDYWLWRLAWHIGLVEGRVEESLRQRVWFP